jgi:hypothetical protein
MRILVEKEIEMDVFGAKDSNRGTSEVSSGYSTGVQGEY